MELLRRALQVMQEAVTVQSVLTPQTLQLLALGRARCDGYKAHIIVDPESESITGVASTAGNTPDAEPLPQMMTQ